MQLRWRRRSNEVAQEEFGAGLVFTGPLWVGDGSEHEHGRVVVDDSGTVTAAGPAADISIPFGALEVDAAWIGPGLVDAHVHLAFGSPDDILRRGVVAIRDLGAPPHDAMRWRALPAPRVQVAGPLLTAPGGYPSRSWGANGFAAFLESVEQATRLVRGLAATVDVIKLALEPRAGPVPDPDMCAAVVAAAHAADRQVTCHALSADMVERALDAGVDELAHTPLDRLSGALVDRIVAAGTTVISTLQTHRGSGSVEANARALVSAGVPIRYGTDFGNAGTKPGADPRELDLLARSGLGAEGALRAATEPIAVGRSAAVVALDGDPRERADRWTAPRAVCVGTTLLLRP